MTVLLERMVAEMEKKGILRAQRPDGQRLSEKKRVLVVGSDSGPTKRRTRKEASQGDDDVLRLGRDVGRSRSPQTRARTDQTSTVAPATRVRRSSQSVLR
jgi:hypothetical protein